MPAPGAGARVAQLPRPATALFGREDEIAAVLALLEDPAGRLIALTGPGGVGKTRLALEAARRAGPRFADGVTFADLQSVRSTDVVPVAIAEAMGLRLQGQRSPRDQLLRALAAERRLLVLDTMEHLLDGAGLVSDILDAAPNVGMLVTSREVLGLNERVYRVGPLPPPGEATEAGTEPAVELFVDRARLVRHNFDEGRERPAVAAICRMVGGMPLAIELAAAWVGTLDCAEIAAEIGRTIDFLSSTRRDLPERHRSMTAVFDYSWGLLSDGERDALARLSVFHGPFTREVAEQVAGTSLPTLRALVQKSLLRFGDGMYDLHELVRHYAEGRLAERGGLAAARAAHGEWFLGELARSLPALGGADQAGALARLEREIGNIRAAWAWACDDRRLVGRAEAIHALGLFYLMRSRFSEGADACHAAVASLDDAIEGVEHAAALATALCQSGWLDLRLGRFDLAWREFRYSAALIRDRDLPYLDAQDSDPVYGLALFAYGRGDMRRSEELAAGVLERARHTGRRANEYAALGLLGRLARYDVRPDEALEYHVRAHELALQAGDEWYRARMLYELGMTAFDVGARADARRYLEAAGAAFDDSYNLTNALSGLATVDLAEGNLEAAVSEFERVAAAYRELQNELGLIDTCHGLGRALVRTGRPAAAAKVLGEGLKLASAAGMEPLTVTLLVDTAELLLSVGRPHRAAVLIGLARTRLTWASREHGDVPRNFKVAEGMLPADDFAEALAIGRELPLGVAVAETLADLVVLEAHQDAAVRVADPRPVSGPSAEPTSGAGSATVAETIRVLVADRHEIVRQGLTRLLAGHEHIAVAGEAATGVETLALAERLRPDVVLLDLMLPDIDGVEVARRLLAGERPARVIVLTSVGDDDRVREAIQAGVIGYLLKDVGRADLVRAVEDVVAGRPALHPDVQRFLMQRSAQPDQPSPLAAFTERERDLLRCLARGLSNRQIAAELGLTHGTVKVYVSGLLDKLGVADRTQAALLAARLAESER